MDRNIIDRVVNDICSDSNGRLLLTQIIPTTMGEPLQYKEFPTFLFLCKKHPYIRLNITTNGSFFGRGVEAWAKVLIPITADVRQTNLIIVR